MDTNVFVYQHHAGEHPEKCTIAGEVLARLMVQRATVISPQVVTEFLGVAKRKLMDEMTAEQVNRVAELMVDEHDFVGLDALTTREALRATRRYGLDYLDAQIWAAARLGGCTAILTEDTHGAEIEGVVYVDPFAEGFDMGSFVG